MKYLMFLALLVALSGCGTVERMNYLVNSSTESIHCNRMAVERSTEVINHNSHLIQESTGALEKNRQVLESM